MICLKNIKISNSPDFIETIKIESTLVQVELDLLAADLVCQQSALRGRAGRDDFLDQSLARICS